MNAIEYQVCIPNPHTHRIAVTLRFYAASDRPEVAMPGWTPGSYLLREFGRHVERLSARVGGEATTTEKTGKATWRIDAKAGDEVVVDYGLYAHELTVRTSHVDGTHAFLSGTSTFLFVKGQKDLPVSVRLDAPDGWQTFTTLDTASGGVFSAPDYDHLVDCPIELGPDHEQFAFDVLGVEHRVVVWGPTNADSEELAEDMAELVRTNAALFGGLPYERYLFIVHTSDKGQGGLEHRDSCALQWRRHGFVGSDYDEFLRLVSHEHFHVWNVKRIRPSNLGPFNYLAESPTTVLWAMEGVTSYYDKRQVLRSGLVDGERYLEWVAEAINKLNLVPGRKLTSLEESSFDAWIKLYRPTENSANATVSYYLLGSLVTLALDLEIRRASEGKSSYDDVLMTLWQRYQETNSGLDEMAFKQIIRDIGGEHLDDWVRDLIERPADPDWNHHLAVVGMKLEAEKGGTDPYLGLVFARGARMKVTTVLTDGPNAESDIYPGDELIALNGFEVDPGKWKRVLSLLPKDGPVEASLFRKGMLHTSALQCGPPRAKVNVVPISDPTPEQLEHRASWLFQTDLPESELGVDIE